MEFLADDGELLVILPIVFALDARDFTIVHSLSFPSVEPGNGGRVRSF
jgi:hypothetical protein